MTSPLDEKGRLDAIFAYSSATGDCDPEAMIAAIRAYLSAARHECAKSGRHDHDGCSCTDQELARQMEAAFLRSADTFQPDPEMFVCMDSTGCYHVSWSPEEHQAKMSHLRAKHEARYVMVAPDQAGEMPYGQCRLRPRLPIGERAMNENTPLPPRDRTGTLPAIWHGKPMNAVRLTTIIANLVR
jgi:hypothetical protein